ncbi:hypothetical protein [Cohnella lupini]|uniref:Uncharacterized protein n=1 Tax=Cohnella lupini TaxID=1294267 RepID=A0A3D9HNT8_9BACL|nr:hypothetical protein [Cohnella lupini]RED51139.1 hypothetical protein DFP95_14710 [Cohnella lupini]
MLTDIEYYRGLSYTVEYLFVSDDPGYPDGYFYGGIVELDACKTDGATLEEFLSDLEVVKR